MADTQVQYTYDAAAGQVNLNWNLTTTCLQTGQAGGATLQGFLPHLTRKCAQCYLVGGCCTSAASDQVAL